MNCCLIVQVDDIKDLNKALDSVIKDVEQTIAVMGQRANCIGVTEDGVFYDMQCDKSNCKSLAEYYNL